MPAIEVGRICVKLRGREAGRKCIIVDIIDDNFVLVTGPKELSGVKRRRINIRHLEPTEKRVSIQKGAQDLEVLEAIKSQGLEGFVRERIRIPPSRILTVARS